MNALFHINPSTADRPADERDLARDGFGVAHSGGIRICGEAGAVKTSALVARCVR